ACLGGMAGLLVAAWGTSVLAWLVPTYMPRLRDIRISGAALFFSAGVSILTGLIFGLAPAWHAVRSRRLHDSLKLSNSSTGRGGRRLSGLLIIAEVALAVVLMAGAGLMTTSVIRMLRVDPGFDPENLVSVTVQLNFSKYAGPDNLGLKNSMFDQ